ncbi:MAG: glycosyltransferase [Dissulfurispiraceae bacterium]
MPEVSVVMPVYNGEKYLEDAIESVLSQTFSEFEFIIIDDCSSDGSPEIIERYRLLDSRIRVLRNSENEGIVSSLNMAIRNAGGRYIARMDCDDFSLPERFRKQFDFLEHNEDVVLLGSAAIIIDENGTVNGLVRWPESDAEIKRLLIKLCPFFHPSVMIRKNVFDYVGVYDRRFRHAEDYELWLRISSRFKISNLAEPLIKYRVLREGSIGATTHREAKRSAARAQWIAIREGLYNPLCLYYVAKNLVISTLPGRVLGAVARFYYDRIITSPE